MCNLQKFSVLLGDKEACPDIYHFFEKKLPWYTDSMEYILDQGSNKTKKKRLVREYACHPSNPNHPEHDPNDADNYELQYLNK